MLQALADFLAGPRYVASSTNRSSRAPRIALCYPISFLPDALYYPFSSRERAGDLAGDPPEAHGSSAGWGSALPILGSGSVCNWRAGNSARSRLSAGSGRLKRRLRPRLAALQGDATQLDPLPDFGSPHCGIERAGHCESARIPAAQDKLHPAVVLFASRTRAHRYSSWVSSSSLTHQRLRIVK
jgi:hypothetical protein